MAQDGPVTALERLVDLREPAAFGDGWPRSRGSRYGLPQANADHGVAGGQRGRTA